MQCKKYTLFSSGKKEVTAERLITISWACLNTAFALYFGWSSRYPNALRVTVYQFSGLD